MLKFLSIWFVENLEPITKIISGFTVDSLMTWIKLFLLK